MTFLFTGVALYVAEVFSLDFFLLDYLGSIDPGGYTVSLLASVIFFKVLGLSLISGRKGLRHSLFLGSLNEILPLGVFLAFF